ncbi:Protein kinase domain [Dillenia turbinata]|uniref:Protein kinase domain n=1 Tax=Dillenia turbinata TaxID=194707 RepID=A0AAN8VJF6_9MAGN
MTRLCTICSWNMHRVAPLLIRSGHWRSTPEATTRSFAFEIVRGLEYLHANGVVHGDIKGRNILVTREGAKIGDFGCVRLVNVDIEGPGSLRIAGTPMFMAPEVARGEEQGYPADIWADLPEIPSSVSDEAKDFVDKCLRRNPAERWSAKEHLEHSFLKENVFVATENHGLFSDSPTCVLDQGVWESTEELEFEITRNSNSRIWSKSAAGRIGELIGGGLMKSPDWNWDKSWVTVRGNDNKEEIVISSVEESSETNYVESSVFDFEFLDQSICKSRKCGCSKSSKSRKSELMMICRFGAACPIHIVLCFPQKWVL